MKIYSSILSYGPWDNSSHKNIIYNRIEIVIFREHGVIYIDTVTQFDLKYTYLRDPTFYSRKII